MKENWSNIDNHFNFFSKSTSYFVQKFFHAIKYIYIYIFFLFKNIIEDYSDENRNKKNKVKKLCPSQSISKQLFPNYNFYFLNRLL